MTKQIKHKILLVSPAGKHSTGGKANFTNLLLEAFKEFDIQHIHLNTKRATSNKIVLRLLQHIFSFVYFKVQFVFILISKKVDIVQIHTSTFFDFYDLSLFVIIAKLFRKKVIVRYGGAAFPSFYETRSWVEKKYIKWVISLYDILIVQSTFWKNYFASFVRNEKQLFILPNFVDTKFFEDKIDKHEKEPIQILYIPGKDLKRKGFLDLHHEIFNLSKEYNDVTIHIVGPKVHEYISGNNIFTYEKIYGKKKQKLFRNCQIFLLPTYREGFPNTLLEAMASKMAIITTDIPQINCIVKHYVHALLIEPVTAKEFNLKIKELLNNKNLVKELGNNGHKLALEKYTTNKMKDYLTNLYQNG